MKSQTKPNTITKQTFKVNQMQKNNIAIQCMTQTQLVVFIPEVVELEFNHFEAFL